jgi:PIN domain nuclease of toxin-antitoxin system
MKILLDTHIFLWYVGADPKLPDSYQAAILDPGNEVSLSVASLWEIAIKHQLGKLPLPAPPAAYITKQRLAHQIASLAIEEADIAALATLAQLHRDPFDRILIAQAMRHGLTIATVDAAIKAYSIPTLPIT